MDLYWSIVVATCNPEGNSEIQIVQKSMEFLNDSRALQNPQVYMLNVYIFLQNQHSS